MPRILVAAPNGLRSFDARGQEVAATQHAGRPVTAVVRDGPELWAIVDGSEIWYAPDERWRQVATLEGVEGTCLAMTDAIHAGTSEARLFRLTDGTNRLDRQRPVGSAHRLESVDAFDAAEGRDAWYTPWGGPPATRSISEWGEDVYVNVHVGGVVHTGDGGANWNPTIDIDADVHQVATAEGLVLAAGARGLSMSTDKGATWSLRSDGLEARYCRAVVVYGDQVLVSASNGPRGGRAAVYRGGLEDGAFERCRSGLPEWFDDNIDTYCLDALNDGSFAAFGTNDGSVYASDDGGTTWRELVTGLPPVRNVLVVPD